MATCQDVITRSLIKRGDLKRDQSATLLGLTDGLERLQSMFDEWAQGGFFGRLTDVYVTEDYTAGEMERITAPDGSTVTIPDTLDDPITGDERSPLDRSVVVVVQGSPDTYMYDGRLGAWSAVSALTLSSVCPFANRGLDGLAAALAAYADEVSPAVQQEAARFRGLLANKGPRRVASDLSAMTFGVGY